MLDSKYLDAEGDTDPFHSDTDPELLAPPHWALEAEPSHMAAHTHLNTDCPVCHPGILTLIQTHAVE